MKIEGCDYLILTASNEHQAAIYRKQLEIRRELGLLSTIRKTLVVPDVDGKRIGSGGSTLCCLLEVLKEENVGTDRVAIEDWKKAFNDKRVLIIHAGGDSKRLPAYGPCGKLFIPVPGQWDSPIPLTLFDEQLERYLNLFDNQHHAGQFIITSGDVLLRFQSDPVTCKEGIMTGFCCPASPEQATRHGVFCLGAQQDVRLYLQKPSYEMQQKHEAVNHYNRVMLDIGIAAFDGHVAAELLRIFGIHCDGNGDIVFEYELAGTIIENGLDFYRELCCVFGSDASEQLHRESAWSSGSTWSEEHLSQLYNQARKIPFHAQVLTQCEFLDFGSVQQIINSGYKLLQESAPYAKTSECLSMNTTITERGAITGSPAWIEGCVIDASLEIEGNNVVTGVRLQEGLSLRQGQCLDVIPGNDDEGNRGWFVRCYGYDDDFKLNISSRPKYCNVPIGEWMSGAGVNEYELWADDIEQGQRHLFNAKLFPFIREAESFKDYLWMHTPTQATSQQIEQWKGLRRYSHADIAYLADDTLFYSERQSNRIDALLESVPYLFRPASTFSVNELEYIFKLKKDEFSFIRKAITTAYSCSKPSGKQEDVFISSRILHTLAMAIEDAGWPRETLESLLSELVEQLSPDCRHWLKSIDILLSGDACVSELTTAMKDAAYKLNSTVILSAGSERRPAPRSCLKTDEIIWARSPARLDVAGGWTDTPPYALEWGGAVLNAAVNLNGQPPIQAYLRITKEPAIKIASIDLGLQVVIQTMDELKNYMDVSSGFSLAKAAFLQEAFSCDSYSWSENQTLQDRLEQFGGGIELTTLAAIPKGSGLGTSSIMGAVIVAAINRALGRELDTKELFNAVLKLEQRLTTGGGWQDQVGGVLEGVKLIIAEPGTVPDPLMKYVRGDMIDPSLNGERTLLYYTGITRLAKNILREVVGRYLNRDRFAMKIVKQIHKAALEGAEAMAAMDYEKFGSMLGKSWQLNKKLDPNSTNEQVEMLFQRISPYIYGAKLLGAGGGGFVLMACKSREDAMILRDELTHRPCEENARFFDYNVSPEGLVVTVC